MLLILPRGTLWGFDRLLGLRTVKTMRTEAEPQSGEVKERSASLLTRRETLENLAGVPLLGVLGYTAKEKYDWEKVHAVTGATIKLPNLSMKDLRGELPQGTLGKLKISRVILGGNLIAGGAHSRT